MSGGIGTYTKQVAGLLAIEKADVHVFAGSHLQTSCRTENDVAVHRVKCTGPQDFQKNVLSVFEKEHTLSRFQIIESAEIHANAWEIKTRFPGLPLIVRLHASNWLVESFKKKHVPLQNKLRFFFGALRRGRWDLGYWRNYDFKNDTDYQFVNMADVVTAPTLQMKNWAMQQWKIDADRIKVLENPFVENKLFNAACTNNEEHTIIFYGRLNVLKGLITATKAMKKILKNNVGWKWLIVGDDGTAADGKSSMKVWMEKELKAVRKQVTFYNNVAHDHLPLYLKKSSIVLIPSLFESYSYVTIEALCAGKAVIGSRGTGVASLVQHNVSGLLVDPYKSDAWCKAIQQLIDNKVLRKILGEAAHRYALSKAEINKDIVGFYKTLEEKVR